MRLLASYDVKQYSPAIILMTDGKSQNSLQGSGFTEFYRESGLDVPVFSIMFGDAEDAQLKALATLTNARVFDGRQDLIDAFRKVKGYN